MLSPINPLNELPWQCQYFQEISHPSPGSSSDIWRLAIIHNSITASITQCDQTLKYSQGNNQITHPTLGSRDESMTRPFLRISLVKKKASQVSGRNQFCHPYSWSDHDMKLTLVKSDCLIQRNTAMTQNSVKIHQNDQSNLMQTQLDQNLKKGYLLSFYWMQLLHFVLWNCFLSVLIYDFLRIDNEKTRPVSQSGRPPSYSFYNPT